MSRQPDQHGNRIAREGGSEPPCSNCGGSGDLAELNRRFEENRYPCHVCKGTGKLVEVSARNH